MVDNWTGRKWDFIVVFLNQKLRFWSKSTSKQEKIESLQFYSIKLSAAISGLDWIHPLISWTVHNSLCVTPLTLLRLGTNELCNPPSVEMLSMQYGSPLTKTSCIIIAKLYTSPGWVPCFRNASSRKSSGAAQRSSGHKRRKYLDLRFLRNV